MAHPIASQRVSPTTTFLEEISLGQLPDKTGRAMVGHSPNITTGSLQTVWGATENWQPLISAEFIRVRAGGHPDDVPGGIGTSQIVCDCLDINFEKVSLLLSTDGSNGVNVVDGQPIQVMRLNGSIGFQGGTSRGINSGDILIESSNTQTLMGTLIAGMNRSFDGVATIGVGKSIIPYAYQVLISERSEVRSVLYISPPPTIAAPFSSRFAIFQTPFISKIDIIRQNFSGSSSIAGVLDIEICAELASGGNPGSIIADFQWTEHTISS